ncbi:hypothetical protein HZF05_01735 [Sphingomonas sp. CGMCC 1.13654]|uniref:Uncharacterized protein n=1 Tax=Sphingomonas chungangi TaxID=2683589 RepID=A0A838L178_9SPHN|nr:hypothetical protein [Sphingomonas chungangi]MBA2932807.1 hypothetical protein [Sphingomonas chungangi]MVW56429.1 hypothetical protein [Sphingomonas chungangi]
MGTVKFDAPAGKIVDLGRLKLNDDWGAPVLPPNPAGNQSFAVIPADGAPPKGRLQGLPVFAADFHAAGKIPNYFGALIDRLPPIPGVIAYERDKVIDLKATGSRP